MIIMIIKLYVLIDKKRKIIFLSIFWYLLTL